MGRCETQSWGGKWMILLGDISVCVNEKRCMGSFRGGSWRGKGKADDVCVLKGEGKRRVGEGKAAEFSVMGRGGGSMRK